MDELARQALEHKAVVLLKNTDLNSISALLLELEQNDPRQNVRNEAGLMRQDIVALSEVVSELE